MLETSDLDLDDLLKRGVLLSLCLIANLFNILFKLDPMFTRGLHRRISFSSFSSAKRGQSAC